MQASACRHSTGTGQFSRFPPSTPPPVHCYVVLCYHSITIRQGRSPAGLSLQTRLAKPGPAASWLGVRTGHPVGGLRHRGTCISRRAFPTITGWRQAWTSVLVLATQVTWFVASGTRWCLHSWELGNVTQARGILLPLPPSCCQTS